MNKTRLLDMFREEMEMKLKGGIYHLTQIKLCYNSNRIEGSRLSEDQTRFIFETNSVNSDNDESLNVDDIIETVNHFSCFDFMLKSADGPLTEDIIKDFHRILKTGTSDSKKEWFNVGGYKKRKNFVGDIETASPVEVQKKIADLIAAYNKPAARSLEDIIRFHFDFECIHPFQDGNGRVGRLVMFRECLANDITPFIIDEEHKLFYYRGLKEYANTPGFLTDTCLSAQDIYKNYLGYFEIPAL